MATNTEIVKRNDYLAEVLGEEMVEGDITRGDQTLAKKNFETWLTTLGDQKRTQHPSRLADQARRGQVPLQHVPGYHRS
jgi:hypothetical protein